MIVIDIEWLNSENADEPDEIVQIGAVRVDTLASPITDTFNVYIRPHTNTPTGYISRLLPDIQASFNSQIDFNTAVEMFRNWCGGDTVFGEWGPSDLKVLSESCNSQNIPPLNIEQKYDLQRAFGFAIGATRQTSLQDAVEYMRIPAIFDFHQALNDAMYAVLVCQTIHIQDTELNSPEQPGVKSVKLSTFDYPKQKKYRSAILSSQEDVLDSLDFRKAHCPICHRRFAVVNWHTSGGNQYYSVFYCSAHGGFICRATLRRTEDNHWSGTRTVPIVNSEVIECFQKSLNGKTHVCKKSSNSHRSWYSRNRNKTVEIKKNTES